MTLIIILIIVFAVAGFLLGYGDGGRGTWSIYISTAAGLIWLGGIIAALLISGILSALLWVLLSFIIAGITNSLGKMVIGSMRS